MIATECRERDVLCITDEIYEHIIFDGGEHIPIATLSGMADRTITISGLSKTFSVTGWRIGWVIASPPLSAAIRKVHDFLTVGAPAPLQEGAAAAMEQARAYYPELRESYAGKRELLLGSLRECGFRCHQPEGAYYIMADFSGFDFRGSDTDFAIRLIEDIGVAAVPGSSFYNDPGVGGYLVRFTFPNLMKRSPRLHRDWRDSKACGRAQDREARNSSSRIAIRMSFCHSPSTRLLSLSVPSCLKPQPSKQRIAGMLYSRTRTDTRWSPSVSKA